SIVGNGGTGVEVAFDGATGVITNTTISQNSTGVVIGDSTVTVNNSTITLNLKGIGQNGFTLDEPAMVNLNSTIVAGNSFINIPQDVDLRGASIEAQNSLIGDALTSGGIVHGQNGNIVGNRGVGSININRVLDTTLRDNGGPTPTHALVSGSPAINAGINPMNLQFDQRGPGFVRVQQGGTDIGAFESPFLPIPPVNPATEPVLAFGAGGGIQAQVSVLNGALDEVYRLLPYQGFTGAVRVALADVNGDGATDVVTAAGPGGGPHIKVFDGRTGQQLNSGVGSFFAYDGRFTGGVFVAAADLNNDGQADIITGADQGGGPHVRAFSGADGSLLFDFFAYGPMFTGGVRVAAGDINGDDRPDIVTGAGPSGGPHVRVFDGTRPDLAAVGMNISGPSGSFFAYPASYTGGVYVSVNNTDDFKSPQIVTGTDQNIGPGASIGIFSITFRQFNSPQQEEIAFQMPNYRGVRVAVLDFNRDGINDYLTATGPGTVGQVMLFSGASNHPLLPIGEILLSGFPFGELYQGGIFVAGSN
ncbi:MAG: VCBS repeat-containing protein, partial [Planctomycetaceae bacterium]|nr:VCBS repeat-containing protein [Planctomycetaceae bacterium]